MHTAGPDQKAARDLMLARGEWITYICDVDHANLRSKKVQLEGFFPVCGQLLVGWGGEKEPGQHGDELGIDVFTFSTTVTKTKPETRQN